MLIRKIYYTLKPFIPRRLQIMFRRRLIQVQRRKFAAVWPIDTKCGNRPENWKGWPQNKQFALVLTHDVESANGCTKCEMLARMEQQLGFRSSFNFVPERYPVPQTLRVHLVENGFEVGVHGLNHDGNLFRSREIFSERAVRINRYLAEYTAVGFRAPAMHHNLDWIRDLNIEYDASTFDTDPFEPQSDGIKTIFPFKVNGNGGRRSYIELPYTLAQDFTLFILLQQQTIDLWKQKLDWVAARGGMVLVNTHPDYMNFGDKKPGPEEYPSRFYRELIEYVREKYSGLYWHALPKEIAGFFRK
jgi:peptidoglycan/xylan/chitin deacetylase (PgdA/CDA1 family)